MNFKPLRFCTFCEIRHYPFDLFQRVRHHKHVIRKSQVGYPISFFRSKSQNPRTELYRRLLKRSPCVFHEQSRIHHSPRPSVLWRVGQHTTKQKTDALLTDRMFRRDLQITSRCMNRTPSGIRSPPPTCKFTILCFMGQNVCTS